MAIKPNRRPVIALDEYDPSRLADVGAVCRTGGAGLTALRRRLFGSANSPGERPGIQDLFGENVPDNLVRNAHCHRRTPQSIGPIAHADSRCSTPDLRPPAAGESSPRQTTFPSCTGQKKRPGNESINTMISEQGFRTWTEDPVRSAASCRPRVGDRPGDVRLAASPTCVGTQPSATVVDSTTTPPRGTFSKQPSLRFPH